MPKAIKGLALGGIVYLLYKLVTGREITDRDRLRAFIMRIWPAADAEARRLGWPRDLIITAASLESGAYRPDKGGIFKLTSLAEKYNNLFGFKSGGWKERGLPVVNLRTQEHIPDPDPARAGKFKIITIMDDFRVYPSWDDSIRDYTRLLTTRSRYERVNAAGKRGDFSGFFQALKDCGYSTHRKYPELLAQVHRAVESVAV